MSNTNNPRTILLAQANTDPGFKVPGAASASASASAQSDAAAANAGIEVAQTPLDGAPVTDTSSRELAIGGGIFIVLLVIFFFVRNAYSNQLVRKRVAPSSAESSGWLLFVGMSFVAAAAVLALMNPAKFLSLAVTGTLLVVGLGSLIGAFFAGRR
ncbi:hypothetical protein [Janthinobacterium agaricidamnosum]|uniref:Transmembrane protein n=1 Tax=Janthinobacterium agaricidamnosum NBRC 102515 = DSM 9628 TaxID=1349767 RepID=W0V248_9BURK|nr:hypothetical protein [Janthinobacterium agaricidamnosum]CDG81700.1 hypothetical protein GJA_1045 [Janthinobacterium agaricidamnosum NBRC 102515 = DSM 9628]